VNLKISSLFLIGALAFGCAPKKQKSNVQLIPSANFSVERDGKQVSLFTLKNANGYIAQITNYGGRVVSLWTPDKNGKMEDIVLGYDSLNGYLKSNEIYYGATIGRYGNRICDGKFTLNGTEYKLATNNGKNTLHGGIKGFCNVVWDAKQVDDKTLELTHVSADMVEGYPGKLDTKVVYQLTDNNELKIEYYATTDKATPVNLTHHSFFNLKGAGNNTINDHLLEIAADNYTSVDSTLIPSGEIAPVEGTPMDFRQATAIGERVEADFQQLKYGLGYDHNWVLNAADSMHFAARVTEPASGRVMEIYTNEPGLQFYGGNFLKGKDVGKGQKPYEYRTAFCLETQHFPDSPNHANFPSTILEPGKNYYSICIYKFLTNNK